MLKRLLVRASALLLILLQVHSNASSQTYTYSYTPVSSVCIDAQTQTLGGVSLSHSQFASGCAISDVEVVIHWSKTGGSCANPTGTGCSYFNEVNYRLNGPSNNEVLAVSAYGSTNGGASTWGGCQSIGYAVATKFRQNGSVIPDDSTPATGTWKPDGGNLNDYVGTSVYGNWSLDAGDQASGDPLLVSGYDLKITTATDNTAPTWTSVPGNMTANTASGQCYAVVSYDTPVASDLCGVTVQRIAGPASGSQFPVGTTTVTHRATDTYGNTADHSFTVTVTDNQPLQITCPSNISVNAPSNQCTATVTYSSATASDNCSFTGPSLLSGPGSGSAFPVGVTTVTFRATQGSSNYDCSFTVTVVDNQNPSISCPSGTLSAVAPSNSCGANISYSITASDNCSATISSSTGHSVSGGTFSVGTTNVSFTAQDPSGNQANCSFQVTVTDETNPHITCPSNMSVNASSSCVGSATWSTPTATDNCSILSVTQTAGPNQGANFPLGVSTVTYRATDVNGNTADCSFTVSVSDVTDPTIACPTPTINYTTGACGAQVIWQNPTISDNCTLPGNPLSRTDNVPLTSGNTFQNGSYTIGYQVTDGSGNTASCDFSFTIADTEDPEWDPCPSNMTVSTDVDVCDAVVNFSIDAQDNCTANPTITQVSTLGNGDTFPLGTTTVEYSVVDGAGNSPANCVFTVTVEDTEFPDVVCPTSITTTFPNCVYQLNDFTGASGIADNCGLASVVQTPPTGTLTGETTVQITATDNSGNASTCAWTITPFDNSVPVFTNCPTEPDSVDVNAICQYFVPDYSTLNVTDDCNSTLTFSQSPTAGTVLSSNSTVTVSVTDGTNVATCVFDMHPKDVIAPTIQCPPNSTLAATSGCGMVIPAYSLLSESDNCDSNLDVTQDIVGPVSGNTIVTMTATDDAGNSTSCSFTVSAEDQTAPTLSCPASVSKNFNANCQYVMEDLTSLATSLADNCSSTGNLVVSQNPSAGTSIGASSSVVVLTVTDEAGNDGTCQITLNLNDNTAPVVVCPSAQTVNVDASCNISLADYTSLVTATDNCPSLSTVTVTQSPSSGSTYNLTSNSTVAVTMTASDGTNQSVCTFNVVLHDAIAPTLQCPSDVVVTGNSNCTFSAGNYTGLVNAQAGTSDNCDGSLTFTQVPTQGTTVQGTTTITVTGTDDAGNSSNCTFALIVEDNTNPTIVCPATQTAVANASCLITLSSYAYLATTDDNCDPNVTVEQSPAAGTTHNSDVVVTLTATDVSENSASCTFTVIHDDQTAPTISCPSNQTVNADANCQFALGDYTSGFATTSDNCDLTIDVTQSPSSGTTQSGTTQVTLTAADDDGNTSTCTFNVTPVDNTAPVITCPSDQVVSSSIVGSNCVFLVPDLTGSATVTDNCDNTVTVTQSPAISSSITVNTTVTLTAQDDNGNTSNCTFQLILNDNSAPTITCPGDMTVDADASCQYQIQDYATLAVASDNCAAEPTVTQGTSPAIGSTIGVGVATTITLTATDDSSNTASCTFDITAMDVTAPTVTCPSSPQTIASNVNCLVFLTDFTSSASSVDNCDGSGLAITQSPVAGSAIGGTTVVTLSSSDSEGNIGQCTFTVQLDDNTPPSISCPATQTVATDATCGYSLADYTTLGTATDNCDLTVTVTQSPNIGANVSGTTQVTLTATDDSGNSSTCTFNVVGEDQEAPTLTNCPADATVSLSASCTYTVGSYSATVSDNCDGSPTVSQSPLAGSLIGGTTTVTITATDASGNSGTCTFVLTPEDVTAPIVIGCPSDITTTNDASICGAVVTYSAITAIDNCDGNVIPQLINGAASGSIFQVGTTAVLYTSTDGAGNATDCSFSVTVNDTEDPIIVCPSNISVNVDAGTCGADVTYSLPSVTDNCTGSITPTLEAGIASGSNFPVGTTTNTYQAEDEYGNTSTCSFTVTVTDDEAPVITCPADITVDNDSGSCDAVVTYSLPTVTDNCTSPITPALELGLASGSTFPLGTTAIRYSATDASGNVSLCSFSVTVEDNEDPVISCPSDTSVNVEPTTCQAVVSYSDATVSDNCNPSITATLQSGLASGSSFPLGDTQITYSADDGNGQIVTCSFTVTIVDNEMPEITCPSDQTEAYNNLCQLAIPDYTALVTTNDNCDASPALTQSPAASSIITGTTLVTMSVEDNAGNTNSCTFTVSDSSPPSVTCPGNQTVGSDINCQFTLPDYTLLSQSSDNCGSTTMTQSPAIGVVVSAQTTVTVTAEDGVGNQASCTFEVILIDNIAPSITCIGNQQVFYDANCEFQLADYTSQASTSDNCDLSPTITQSPAPGSMLTGTSVVTFTSTDDEGNSASCTFSVLPVDNIPPSITCPSTQMAQLDANCEYMLSDYSSSVSSTDNCNGAPTVSQSPAVGSVFTTSTIVTMTAVDGAGNSASCLFLVEPEDAIAPVITCPSDAEVDLDADCEYALVDFTNQATVTDNCSSNFNVSQSPIAGTVVTSNTLVTLTAQDVSGNASNCTFTITPVDNLGPTMVCSGDITVSFDQNCAYEIGDYAGFASVTDNCSGTIAIDQNPSTGILVYASTNVVLTATDASGNSSTCSFNVNPTDDEDPVIVCPSDQDVAFGNSCSFVMADYTSMTTATDNCSGNVLVSQDYAVGSFVGDTVLVTMTANDGNGNQATCSFWVNPSDITDPTVTCPTDQFVEFDSNCQFEMPNYKSMVMALDNCPNTFIAQAPEEGTSIGSSTSVAITVTDGAGNTAQCSFMVIPSDVNAPTVTCPSDMVVDVDANCQFELGDYTSSASAQDNCSSNLTYSQFPPATVVIVSTTTVTITAQDDAGNEGTCSFSIQPEDNMDPVITSCPPDQTVSLNANCQFIVPNYSSLVSGTDNCDATLSFQQLPAAGSQINVAGTSQVGVALIDDNGNYSACQFNLTVEDATAPVVACPSDQVLNLDGNCEFTVPDYTSLATASDACGTVSVTQSPAAGSTITSQLNATIIATDGGGNTASCTFLVDVVEMSVSVTGTDVTCSNGNDGTAIAVPTGGTGPYTQDWGGFDPNALVAGQYSVTVTDANGCAANGSVTIGSGSAFQITIDPSGDIEVCPGESVVLSAGAGYAQYNWSTGATVSSITVTNPASYWVTVVNANGCVSNTDTVNVAYFASETPTISSGTDGVLYCSNDTATNYQWSFNGTPISGATNSWYCPTQSGNYVVELTDANGCVVSSFTSEYTYSEDSPCATGIEEYGLSMEVYPNPSTGQFTLSYTLSNDSKLEMAVLDQMGRQVIVGEQLMGSTGRKIIDLSGEADGVYILRMLINDENVTQRRLVLIK
ncbi:MAG: HYR domain-containing protein [Flavobacteriales bacterium]|nr:HYR domain-containing protein [Flavobacteriales bacterium]